MNKIISSIGCTCFLLVTAINAEFKTAKIEGPIVAPWVKEKLCARYYDKSDYVKQCWTIKAGQTYECKDIPYYVNHLKITRTFEKECQKSKKCAKAKGMFDLHRADTTLNLTYDNSKKKILKDFTIPPAEPQSNFGLPQEYASHTQAPNYRAIDVMA
jgi:hypothetical protein